MLQSVDSLRFEKIIELLGEQNKLLAQLVQAQAPAPAPDVITEPARDPQPEVKTTRKNRG